MNNSFKSNINKFFNNKTVVIVLKILAFLLFVVYLAQLFVEYNIDGNPEGVKTLLSIKRDWYSHLSELTGADSSTALFMFYFMIILRWSTIVFVGLAVITPFYTGKTMKIILGIGGLIVGVLNFIFLKYNYLAWDFNYYNNPTTYPFGRTFSFMSICFISEIVLLLFVSAYYFIENILKNDYKYFNWKRFPFIIVGLYATFFYQPIIFLFVGKLNQETTDFSTAHILCLLSNIAFLIIGYFSMRHKTIEDKNILFACLTLSGMFNFFYFPWRTLNNFPLHLCNAAIVLMFIAFLFKVEGIFYFTYFVNVIGALFAMAMPNNENDAFSLTVVRFWYNHVYAFVVPILGVALGVYKRPRLQQMGKAIIWFTIYYVAVIFCNPWFSSYPSQGTIDYFFIYKEPFYLNKLGVGIGSSIYNFLWEKTIQFDLPDLLHKVDNIHIVIRPYYDIAVYIGFVGLMFLMWYIYDFLYKTSDSHYALRIKKQLIKQGYIDLRKELNGRSIKEPLYEEKQNMIEIKNFTKIYSGSKKKAVDDLTLVVPNGTVYGFLGHNGAGKSTTIKSIVGIQTITSGQILVEGYDVAKQSVEAKLQIGYVSDNHAVYERLTGREYINYIADLYMVPQKERDERIQKYCEMFKLTDAIDQEAKSYSHGMKQKLVVIASLIHDPKVWVLDEPLTGLDPTSAFQIKECMREHANRGNIVFFSSHVIEVVEKICDHICIINHGKLVCQYSMEEIHKQGISLEELYMKYLKVEDERA